ncbi:protein rapunzel-like [Triplophysa dalaica]|uniref:protein rapunzel-like n=1 Tax=Triplophysa dalaica TaxID=1582913 RepID=UPI0024E02F91|nr:protein rapunzel-like [Triplophysa dalaica]
MAELLKNCFLENKDLILKILEQGTEVIACISRDLSPLFAIVAPFVKLGVESVESKEAQFMKEQFLKLGDRLKTIFEENRQINDEIKKSQIDTFYSSRENNLTNHFRKLMDMIEVKDERFRQVRKEMFMSSFDRMNGEKDLNSLYDAVIGNNMFGESILDMALNYEQKSRRRVEEYCAMLKQLFCIGLIALLAYTAMEGGGKEEKLLQEWNKKMKVIQSKIDEVIKECTNSFPTQAEQDAEHIVREHADKNNQQLADMLMDHLKKKYDWVCWSVRVFNSPKGLFAKKKDFQGAKGKSQFQVSVSNKKLNVVISYSASPNPVDKALMLQLILAQIKYTNKRSSMMAMAKKLFVTTPYGVVHTVKTSCKDLVFSHSFSVEQHFSVKLQNVYVFLHTENEGK